MSEAMMTKPDMAALKREAAEVAYRLGWSDLEFEVYEMGVNGTDHARQIETLGQAKWWSHYFGTIPREQFEVQLRGRAGYVTPTASRLERIAADIDRELENYEFYSPSDAPNLSVLRAISPSHDPWLFRDGFPAERFAVAAEET